MVKKRVRDPEVLADAPPAPAPAAGDNGSSSSSDDDVDMVNVEFEWFNFKPSTDFHGLKSLLRQLLDVDSPLFDLSSLTNLILSQPTIGSTVKVDGEDTDAYAFLTILNLHVHSDDKSLRELTKWLLEKAKSCFSASSEPVSLSGLLAEEKGAQVGLVLAERMINVPAEIAPPMYSMLIDEIEAAVEDGEPYEFTHYLILSKVYREIESALDQEEAPKTKKNKGEKGGKGETFYFHPEDEVLKKHALASGTFEYTKDEGEGMADSKRAFQDMGIKPQGSMILIEASKFEGAIKAISEYLSPP